MRQHYHRRVGIVVGGETAYLADQGVQDRAPDEATAAVLIRRAACATIATALAEGFEGRFRRSPDGAIDVVYVDSTGTEHQARFDYVPCTDTAHQSATETETRHVA